MLLKKIIVLLALASLLGFPTKDSAEELVIVPTLDQQLEQVFGDKAPLMKAIAQAESNLEEDQVSHNRRNDGSTWSVDCGVLQINVRGNHCPDHLLTVEGNLKQAKQILDEQGLRAWVVYKTGAYKKYL